MPYDPDDPLFKASPAMALARDMLDGSFFDARGMPDPNIGPDGVHRRTHSHPIGSNTKPGSIARHLLNCAPVKGPAPALWDDPRPLIDILHEATFRPGPGLGYVRDMRELRELLRKAKCFTLDSTTSSLVSDLSVAVAADLNTVRQMAIPPFPVTWVEMDNTARLKRMQAIGVPLTHRASGQSVEGEAVPRVGWLIYPGYDTRSHYASYVTVVEQGVLFSPMGWWWHTAAEPVKVPPSPQDAEITRLTFGVTDSNVPPGNALMCPTRLNLHGDGLGTRTLHEHIEIYSDHVYDYMNELAGELRHIFGLLATVSAGHAGITMETRAQDKYQGPSPVMPNGKPLFPLEHKHLHLHLGKHRSLGKVVAQMITRHRARYHDVRAHMRKLQSGRLVPVKSHHRGDQRLGVITKDYIVEK